MFLFNQRIESITPAKSYFPRHGYTNRSFTHCSTEVLELFQTQKTREGMAAFEVSQDVATSSGQTNFSLFCILHVNINHMR